MLSKEVYKNRIKDYAYKYIADVERENIDINKLNDNDIITKLSNCIIRPKKYMIKEIKDEIINILKEE